MNLIYVKHPDPVIHKKQIDLLEQLQDFEKPEQAQLIRIANASLQYYYKAEPTQEDFEDLLTGLPEHLKKIFEQKGYEKCIFSFRLKRHSLERQDIGMSVFVRELLNDEDFEIWLELEFYSK